MKYVVEKIIAHKIKNDKMWLNVKWEGYGYDDTTWQEFT